MEGVVGHASSVSGVKDVFSKVSLWPQQYLNLGQIYISETV